MAVTSTEDGSVVIGVDMNVSEAEKELARLKKSIAILEKDIQKSTEKRDKAQKESLFKVGVLDAEKGKLQEIKDRLADLQAMSKDKAINFDTREEYKALIPDVKAELADQKTRVNALQAEWNKIDASVEQYENKINDATAQLTAQKAQAGALQEQIDEANAAVSEMAVADQRVVDLNRELLDLKQRQKELDKLGVGFGYEEYDRNAARIADITRELKDYQKALSEVKASETEIKGPEIEIDERRSEILERQRSLVSGLSEQLHALNELASEIAGSIGKKIAETPIYEKLAPKLSRLKESIKDAFSPLYERLDLGEAKKSVKIALDGIQNAFSNFSQNVAPNFREAFSSIGLIISRAFEGLKNIPGNISSLLSGLSGFAGVLPKIGYSALNAFNGISKTVSSAENAVWNFWKAATKTLVSATKNAILFAAKLNAFSKLSDGLSKKFRRLGMMIRRVFVFSVILSGLRAIRSQLSGYLKVNAEFTTALRRLQGVFLTAFQPIYEVVVPALTTLINALSRAAAVVTQFFAALFGTTAKQAQVNAKNLYEQAHATEAAGKAAEKASKQFADFDEIQKISGETSSGGGAAIDTGPLFDYEYDETPFDTWGEAFNAFLDKLLAGIQKLRDAFKNFADGLNDWSKKVFDMFTFPGVLDKVKQLGSELAEALNDLVNWIDWNQLGRAFGSGLNTALNFLTSFIYTFDWINLGKKLSEFINGLVDEIDWYEFGRLLWAGWKIALETLAGFILNLNMPLMAHAATQTVLGFFTEMKNTIDRIDWSEIGAQIGRFLTNIDFEKIFGSIYNAIFSALEGIRKLLTGFFSSLGDWAQPLVNIINTVINTIEQLMDTTRKWASSINLKPISDAFGNLLTAIDKLVAVISAGLLWAYENVLLPLAGWAIEKGLPVIVNALAAAFEFLASVLEILAPVAKVIWTEFLKPLAGFAWGVISGALQVITNILRKLTDLLSGNTTFREFWENLAPGEKIILGLAASLVALSNPVALAVAGIIALTKAAADLIPGLKEGIEKGWESFKNWLSGIWQSIVDGFKSFFGVHSPSTLFAELGGYLIAGLLQGISDTWNSITEFFSTAVESLKQFFATAWESIKTTASTAWEAIKTDLSQKWENIKETASTAFTSIKDKIVEVWDNIQQKTSEIWNSIKTALTETWENLKRAAQEKFDAIKQKISEVWENVKSKTSSVWNSIKSTLTSIFENLKSAVSTTFDAIKTRISQAWDNVKTATSTAWQNIKNTVSNSVKSIFDNVSKTFNDLVSSAFTWGSDICKNIADGIARGVRWVTNAVKDVADSIKDFLGFSEPKKGPLSDFHTYMPDMLELMSDGIRGNAHLATGAASDLAKSIADSFNKPYTLGNVRMGKMPDISAYNIPAIARGEVIPANREFTEVINREYRDSASTGAEIENAVARAMRSAGMSGGNITVVMEIDGREFGRASYKYGTQEQQRVGVRLTEAR